MMHGASMLTTCPHVTALTAGAATSSATTVTTASVRVAVGMEFVRPLTLLADWATEATRPGPAQPRHSVTGT
uniref:Secreted protein n=1 Tax=Oryza brachyantha TaxID=4533 RepID=J3N5H7_ORYBR